MVCLKLRNKGKADKMLKNIKKDGDTTKMSWKTGGDVFAWWMGENTDQLKIDESWWII